MPTLPMTAVQVLDRHFLEVRGRLLEIAATLDRMDRAGNPASVADDARRQKLQKAFAILASSESNRAEQLQMLFSRPYDSEWINDLPAAGR